MKILYIAKHAPVDNRDEEAVAYAFEKLGHEVIKIEERQASTHLRINYGADFLLFHHCDRGLPFILNYQYCPKIFWTFDLFTSTDPGLSARMFKRQHWLKECVPHIALGFMSDGDCVQADKTGKLVHLMQGADERFVGYGEPKYDLPPILFTGTSKHGLARESHIKELKERYGDKFWVMGEDGPRGRKHGRELADIFASVKIVIAPDGPNTDNYHSNRLYLTTGLRGFLLHPFGKLAANHSAQLAILYMSRQHLNELIDDYLAHPEDIEEVRRAQHEHTIAHHLYRHRCEQMIETIKQRIL